jgi:hypothetical protein
LQIFTSHVETPGEFYLQLVKNNEALDQLMEELAATNFSSPSRLEVGCACAAQFSEDGSWYRARVKALLGDSATVQYVDYGNSEDVAVSTIKGLPSHMLVAPFTLQCQLEGATSLLDQTDAFSHLVLDQELTAEFSGDCEPLTVTMKNDAEDIRQLLLSAEGQAVSVDETPTSSEPVTEDAETPEEESQPTSANIVAEISPGQLSPPQDERHSTESSAEGKVLPLVNGHLEEDEKAECQPGALVLLLCVIFYFHPFCSPSSVAYWREARSCSQSHCFTLFVLVPALWPGESECHPSQTR